MLLEPRLAEHGVRVRIDEARSENAAVAVNHFGVGVRVFEIGRGADHRYSSFADCDSSISQDACVAHLLSFARSCGTGACNDLGGVYEENVFQESGIRGWLTTTATYDYRPGASGGSARGLGQAVLCRALAPGRA